MDTNPPTATLDQRRIWLDELLARPHLWPSQIATARLLAAELNIPLTTWQLDLNNPTAGWQPKPASTPKDHLPDDHYLNP